MPRIRLLLLSVGSLVAHRFFEALGTRRGSCILVGTNSLAEAAGNFRCDTTYVVPPAAAGERYIERVAEVIETERPDLVIPTRDDDVLALATLAERGRHTDAVLLCGSVAAAHIMNDKLETTRFAQRHGLPFAPTVTTAEDARELASAHGLPLVGKPRRGNASRGVVLLRSLAEIRRAFELRSDLIVQPFLDPPADIGEITASPDAGLPLFFSFPETRQYFLQGVIGPDGATSSVFGTISVQVGGQAVRTERCEDADLLEVGRRYLRVAAAEGWRGPLNVQLKRTPRGLFVAHELNGRVSGGTAARALLGFDEIAEIADRFLPRFSLPRWEGEACDMTQQLLTSYAVPREALAQLESTGRWSRRKAD